MPRQGISASMLYDVLAEVGDLETIQWVYSMFPRAFPWSHNIIIYEHWHTLEWYMLECERRGGKGRNNKGLPFKYIAGISRSGRQWCIEHNINVQASRGNALVRGLLSGILDEEYMIEVGGKYTPEEIKEWINPHNYPRDNWRKVLTHMAKNTNWGEWRVGDFINTIRGGRMPKAEAERILREAGCPAS